jgi:hypothetical protein
MKSCVVSRVLALRVSTRYHEIMNVTLETVHASIRELPDSEKSRLVNDILVELDRPDETLDALWLSEVRERREAYRQGRTRTLSYAEVLERYSRP